MCLASLLFSSMRRHFSRWSLLHWSSLRILNSNNLGNPATSRSVVAKLVRLTRARAFSVRYRLAPQNPFPAALLDLLVACISMLYPLTESFHPAVSANSIVFTGENSGANLGLSLLQLLLELYISSLPPFQVKDSMVKIDLFPFQAVLLLTLLWRTSRELFLPRSWRPSMNYTVEDQRRTFIPIS